MRRAPQLVGTATGTLARAVRRTGRRLPGLKPSLEDAILGGTVALVSG